MGADLDPAVADLHELLRLGLSRAGHLLTAGERVIVDRILALSPDAGRLFALCSARRHDTWPLDGLAPPGVADPAAAVAELVDRELADHLVPWAVRAERCTRADLAAGCRALGLPTGGRRAELVERLRPHQGWRPGRWLRLRHRGLIRRLERWALLRKHPDRSVLVVERLGHVRWPDYTPGRGSALHRDRRALLAWEALLEPRPVDEVLQAVAEGAHRAPGRLDLGRRLREGLLGAARELERAGRCDEARALYLETHRLLGGAVAVRVARTFEAEGRPDEALAHLRAAVTEARPTERIGIERTGRRLASKLRRAWPPSPPLQSPRTRTLRLVGAHLDGPRPGYAVDGAVLPVEGAVIRRLASLGRRALHAEGPLWSTLFALLFAETYFLPVPGALPVRFLAGPLDLGSPAFRARRADAVEGVLEAVRSGEAPARVRAADARLRGVRLAGAAWQLADGGALADIAEGLGPRALADLLEHLLDRGWRSARGLPDLVVLPGPAASLPDAHPGRLGSGLLLAEVKGPGDTVRDEQAVWFDRLLRLGAPVELWEVRRVDPPGSNPAPDALEEARG